MYRALRLCSNQGGFEAIPERREPLDLAALAARLASAGLPVVDARVMLIVRLEAEVTIARSGRLLIKSRDPELAERTFVRLRTYLESTGRRSGGSEGPESTSDWHR